MMEEDFSSNRPTRVFSGAPWERKVGYCRAIRSENHICVSGTAPINSDGGVAFPNDAHKQALRCFEIIEDALKKLGAERTHVLRTRMFVTDISRWEEYGRAHGEYFGANPPATSMIEVKSLIDPQILIEIEAEAIVDQNSSGKNLTEKVFEWRKDDFLISTDRRRLNIESLFQFLTHAYWAKGRSRETILRTIENSLCFGLYQGKSQIGFARVATDFSVFAYLMDVYVLGPHRKQGLGSWLAETALFHPDLGTVKWILATTDAHDLYKKFGFVSVKEPCRLMERKAAQ